MNEDKHPLSGFTQDAVMHDYITSGAFRNKEDAGLLHMFFSPHRVPLGLNADQIRICLNISRLKDERDEAEKQLALSKVPEELRYADPDLYEKEILLARIRHIGSRQLPDELLCSDFMDEERFRVGICKFLSSL